MPRVKVGKPRKPMMVMHKEEKKRQRQSAMQWLLAFLNEDIDSLNPVDCLKLDIDLQVFTRGFVPSREWQKALLVPESDSTKEREFLKKSQAELREILEKILITEKQIEEETEDTFVPGTEERPLPSLYTYVVSHWVMVGKDRVFKERIFTDWEHVCPLPHLRKAPDSEGEELRKLPIDTGMHVDAMVDLLSLFPLSRIKVCQKSGCGNYFYQKTTKSGDFCSPKCQSWARTNRWRQNHRDQYNEYHRARRDKARQDRVEVYCGPCGFRESRSLLEDYLKSYSGPEDCPRCKNTKLWHTVIRWDKDERDWVREPYDEQEWNRYLRETQKLEG